LNVSIATAVAKFGLFPRFAAENSGPPEFARGVGHDPHALSLVRSTNVGSAYAFPFRVIPERGQVSENIGHSPSKEAWNILQHDPAGS
jgi:hypothetical protein